MYNVDLGIEIRSGWAIASIHLSLGHWLIVPAADTPM